MRKGTHVLYFGELYTVYQKRGESVTIYKPDATCPEATMINTAATKVQPAPLEYGYIITSYTTSTGHDRVEITTFKNAWPFMDIPAGELDAHREEIQINTCGRAWFIDKRTNKDEERNQETPEPAQHTEEENTMKEIKRGDFTGIYSQIDRKPLFYTGQYDYMECGGLPCVWLATDIHNNLTFSRWSQQELNKRGWTIPPRPVDISKTAMQMIQKAGAMIRWTTAEERRQANTDHKRKSPYILTASNGGQWYTTGTCADVREVLKAAADEATTRPQDGHTAPETETAGETTTSSGKAPQEATSEAARRFTIYTDSSTAGIDSRGAYTTKAEARMRLEKELDEDETSRGGYIFDEERQKVTAIYNGFNLEKIPEPYRGTPDEYTTRKEAEAIRATLEEIKRREEAAQDGPTRPETVTDEETPTEATKASQEASQDATPATAAGAQESTPGGPTTAGTIAADTRTAGATKDTPQGQERATAAGGIAAQMKNANKPGHACENAPGRTERAHAEQVHTQHTKSPPRAAQKAGQNTSRSSQDRRKVTFSAWMPKIDPIPM